MNRLFCLVALPYFDYLSMGTFFESFTLTQ